MEVYEILEIEVIEFEPSDVITDSTTKGPTELEEEEISNTDNPNP